MNRLFRYPSKYSNRISRGEYISPFTCPFLASKVEPRVFDKKTNGASASRRVRHSRISTGAPWHLDDIKMKFAPSGPGERREKILVSVFEAASRPLSTASKRIETKTGRKRVWTPLMGFVDEEKNERRPTVVGIIQVDPIKSDVS